MGIYQLLFTAEDPDILEGFCRDNLGALEEYDRLHNGCLVDTLYYDLLTGGSVKAVAEAMYTHRNTVNYRIGKIREILGTDLDDADERTRYRMAFYARDILQKMIQTRDSRLASQGVAGKQE
jgi:DNA-binding PucR family transcriptional regulator